MVTVRAREAFTYDGIERARGDVFHASPEDAKILSMIGRVETPRDDPALALGDEPETHLDVENDASPSTSAPRQRRNYRRKDIVAE